MTVGTYAINWSDTAVGKDLVFDRLGYTIEHTDIPSGVGATGSLKWPANLGNNANVFATLTLTLASAGTVAFQWRADGESSFDGGRFYIDGVQKVARLGTTTWAPASFSVASGTHTFKWAYTSDSSTIYGQQTLWLAMLSITNVQDPPPITVSALTPAVYDMEDGAIPAIVSGPWINSTSSPIDGSRSLRSPLITAGSATYDAVWVFAALPESGVFAFKWKHDAERADRFQVFVGATLFYDSYPLSGTSGAFSMILPAGATGVTHRYIKDATTNIGQDASWVDDVSIPFQVSGAATFGTAATASDVALAATLTSTLSVSGSMANDVALSADLTVIPTSAVDLVGATADDVALSADLTVTLASTILLGAASTGSDMALAATLNLDLIHLLPWTDGDSGKTLLDIVLLDAELDITPPFAEVDSDGLPPIGTIANPPVVVIPGFPPVLVERVLTRKSVTVPAMAPGLDGRVHINDAVYDAYPTTVADVGVVHTIIGGMDCTYFRGSPVGGTEHLSSPFGDIEASVSFPQITPQDQPGTGVLSWLDHDKSFERIMVHPSGSIRRLWSGHLYSDDGGNDASGPRTSWDAHGTLFQASTFGHRVPLTMQPADCGTIIARSLNRVIGRVYPVIPVLATGIMTTDRGASSDSELTYVQNLLAKMWTAAGRQWTIMKTPGSRKTYRLGLKDMTAVHHTFTVGQRGVEINLSRDMTSTVNCIFGHGILPNGYAWSGRVWPNFHPDTTLAYPFTNPANVITVGTTDAGTDSGSGVSDWQQKVNDLNLTPDVKVDGVFNTSDSDTLRVIQRDGGLLVDGVLGPQSWAGTFNGGDGNSGNLFGSYRRPLACHTSTEPYLYSASGAVIGKNPGYTAARRYELDINYGAGSTRAQAKVSALLQIARDRLPGYVGTITLLADSREDSRFNIIPNQNIKLVGYNGRDLPLHVVSVDRDYDSLVVTSTVDEKARDAMTVASIRERDKASKADPGKRPGFTPKKSALEQDLTVEFDGDSPAGIIPKTALYPGLWIRIPFPLSQQGSIAKIELTTSPPTKFYHSLFNSVNVTPAHLVNLVGNPGTGTEPYARTDAKGEALDALGLIQGYGEAGAACGYGLKSEGTGTLSGKFVATSPQTYNAQEDGAVSLLVFAEGACSISGRIYPSPVQ